MKGNNMKKQWEVLVWFDPVTKERDVRSRSDIDTHSQHGFKRLPNGQVEHQLVGTNFTRIFTVVYISGTKRDADHFADTLRMSYAFRKVDRSIMNKAAIGVI